MILSYLPIFFLSSIFYLLLSAFSLPFLYPFHFSFNICFLIPSHFIIFSPLPSLIFTSYLSPFPLFPSVPFILPSFSKYLSFPFFLSHLSSLPPSLPHLHFHYFVFILLSLTVRYGKVECVVWVCFILYYRYGVWFICIKMNVFISFVMSAVFSITRRLIYVKVDTVTVRGHTKQRRE